MEQVQIDDFTRFQYLSGIEYSPDGGSACFIVSRADAEKNEYFSDLWVYGIRKNRCGRLTASGRVKHFLWQRDGRHIVFSELREESDRKRREGGEELTVFYRIGIDGGEAVRLFEVPKEVQEIREIDDKTFALTALSHDAASADRPEDRDDERDYEVLEEIPFWRNGVGFTSGKRKRLYLFHEDTQKLDAVTDALTDVEGFELNAGRTSIVFTGLSFRNRMEVFNAVYRYDLNSREPVRLTPEGRLVYSNAAFLNSGAILYTAGFVAGTGAGDNPRIYRIGPDGGEPVLLTPSLDVCLSNSVGTDCRHGQPRRVGTDGESYYFHTTEGDSSYVNRIDVQGRMERLTSAKGSVDDFAVRDGRILLIALRGLRLQELYSLDSGTERQVTRFNDWVGTERQTIPPEPLSVPAAPGVTVDGWVIPPAGFESGKKYPAILDIHGGPRSAYGAVFFHEMQFLSGHGYFVFFCNPRGSEGKGNAFADIKGRHGTIDYEDLMRFTDAVLKKYPSIDAGRVGVTGGSYGGFMTNWIIGHTDRFRAAVSQRSISNFISKFGTTDNGYYFNRDQYGATPWEDQEKMWDQSPLKYADRVRTPTLFLHSDEDYRCFIGEGIQMFTALKFHGVESRMCLFHGENHGLSVSGGPKHRIRRLREMADWFDRHLKEDAE